MNLIKRITQQRNEHILRKAAPFLDDSEEIIGWVRARHPKDGRRGVFFITSERWVVHWTGRKDGHETRRWAEVRTWGLNEDTPGGPVIAIESLDSSVAYVRLVVETKAMATTLRSFMQRFGEVAPWPQEGPEAPDHEGHFAPRAEVNAAKRNRTISEHAQRIIVTILGIALILIGILIIPLPGPWSFILNIAGLAVLAREYDLADDLLDWTKEKFASAKRKIEERRRRKA